MAIQSRPEGTTLSVSGAARLLGVHANTIRAWTDQGRLPCVRINDRGDRRYLDRDLLAFLADAGLQPGAAAPFQSRLRPVATRRLQALPDPVRELTMALPTEPGAVQAHRVAIDPGGLRTRPRVLPTASSLALSPSGLPATALAAGGPALDDTRLLAIVAALTALHLGSGDAEATQRSALRQLRDLGRFSMLAVGRWAGGRLAAHLTEGSQRARAWWQTVDPSLARVCCAEARPLAATVQTTPDLARRVGRRGEPAVQVYAPIGSAVDPWGVLIAEAVAGIPVDGRDLELLAAVAGVLGLAAGHTSLAEHLAAVERRADDDERELERTATWAAQLQSIQALGARLARLATVAEIGFAICYELRDLIEYHNVRVYRVIGDDVVPVAWRGEVGEYVDESGEELHLKVGEGITGWVAQHGLPEYLPNAVADPRAATIPGTEDDLDESMLLAPMRYEDRVIGVIVLSKLGLDQFGEDDLRYLEIYASMAAQAMVNADTAQQLREQSERLARQLETQRELIRVTESILSSLDPHTVVAEICDRLGTLVPVDTLGLDLYDQAAGQLVPMYARGVDAEAYLGRSISDQEGVGGWVARHGLAQLVQDELSDDRVAHFDTGPEAGALIVTPLLGRDGVAGVLTLERLGPQARFEDWEFELVNLFSGHVSIALANAVTHQAVEHRAMTDALTGLKNQGTFADHLGRAAARGAPFSLLIVDLDDFKSFNDRDGHEAGNRLLQTIARAVEAAGRESDEVYRYGGDELALILPGADVTGGLEVARRVGAAVAATSPGRVTCSIGVATFPEDGADREAILLAADRACYVAKRTGRARVVTAAEAAALPGSVPIPPPTPVDDLEGLPPS
jgi:diguanylate cyclase (GGDEF)-like protein/excisionase family DNA binding protein